MRLADVLTADAGELLVASGRAAIVHREIQRRSGGTCPFYVEGRRLALNPDVLAIAGPVIASFARAHGATHVGGEPAASLPIAGAALYAAMLDGYQLHGCYFRESTKPTGINSMLEGDFDQPSRIIFVDDVVGLGSVGRRCIEVAESFGHVVVGAFALVSRDGGRGMATIEALGLPTGSLLAVDPDGVVTLGSAFATLEPAR